MVAEQHTETTVCAEYAYCLSNSDTDVIKEKLNTVYEKLSSLHKGIGDKRKFLLSSKRHLTSLSQIHGYSQLYITLCRKYNLLKNDRVTLLSPMDQLVAIQLCLAEKNKQEFGDFDVETSVVLQASKDISQQKLLDNYDVTSCTQESGISDIYEKFLEDCNSVDTCDVYIKVKKEMEKNEELKKEVESSVIVLLDAPKTLVEQKMAALLSGKKLFYQVHVEVPLTDDDDISVSVTPGNLEEVLAMKTHLSTVKKPPSMTEAYVRLVFLSYLDLLINSRSELSLARVFNVPERELTHSAFTSLKHQSKEKNMTMYQTAISYVMRLRLGRGNAPDPNSVLREHIKGISEFVSLMQRMETVIEEDMDIRSACKRTINILKKELIKCQDSKIRNSSVESVTEQLQSQLAEVIGQLDSNMFTTPYKAPSNGGSLTSRRARKAIRLTLDKLATVDEDLSTLDHLTDIYSSQRTPLRFPSVISQFRSPVEELDMTSPDNKFSLSLSERMMNRMNKTLTPVYAKRYKSTMDWAEPVHEVDLGQKEDIFSSLSQTYVIPSKTIVHAGSKLSSGEANKVLESLLDKENVTGNDVELTAVMPKETNQHKQNTSKNCNKEKQSRKRPLDGEGLQNHSSQPSKKKKESQSKSCRRKLLPQVKGQQQLSKFFRV